MSAMDEEVAAYAAAVRAELADIPEPDRQELLADLEEHLTEVAAESGPPAPPPGPGEEGADGAAAERPGARLAARLGTPAAYATELRAAYGMDTPRKRGRSLGGLFSTAELGPSGRDVVDKAGELLAEFRPTWWLARGYALALVLWWMAHHEWSVLPQGIVDVLLLVLAVAGSVALGRRIRDAGPAGGPRGAVVTGTGDPDAAATTAGEGEVGRRRPQRALLIAANVAAAVCVLFVWLFLPAVSISGVPAAVSVGEPYANGHGIDPSQVVNIYPYSRDGKPLDGVLLYDQDGAPITLAPDEQGLAIDRPCGGPPAIANSYPLRLTRLDPSQDGMPGDPGSAPDARPSCAAPTPSPVPHPSLSSTPGLPAGPSAPASPSASASPSATG